MVNRNKCFIVSKFWKGITMEKVWVLRIAHYLNSGMGNELEKSIHKVFSSKDNAEKWMMEQGLVYGKCMAFKTEGVDPHWFHQNDTANDFVNVTLAEMEVDNRESEDWLKFRLNKHL